ncbi:MAG: peptidoglycan-binding domain-containing protein [Nitrospiraceae bacterium]|nr:peptidoglycan-binding domain-containing protein [Nitrospiraceae bacterium]
MAIYKLGSTGGEVARIQQRLKDIGLYLGPIDGQFGGGTDSAVRNFQKSRKLGTDGIVGTATWKALFVEEMAAQGPGQGENLNYRCLALTGAFETGAGIPECFTGLSGDFDGQGLSFGVCQWNFGQGSLQPLLDGIIKSSPNVVKAVFQSNYNILVSALGASSEELMNWARSIQHPVRHTINEPWRGMFKALGRTEEFQGVEVKYSRKLFNKGLKMCADYGLWSERAASLMFDILVQNGSIGDLTKAQILSDFSSLSKGLPAGDLEEQKMIIIANRRADAAKPQWREDVRGRKLCCAKGSGNVHGIFYDLDSQFGIGLTRLK